MSIYPDEPDQPLYIATVRYMWDEGNGKKLFHGHWYSRSNDTMLGEMGDPYELFVVNECDDNPVGAIVDKIHVSQFS